MSDPRIVAYGIEARTATIYSTKLRLTAEGLRGGSMGPKGAIKHLRSLDKSVRVEIKEPESNRTFYGYVVGVHEKAVGQEGESGFGYEVTVLIQRWDVMDEDLNIFTWDVSSWDGPDVWGP